MEYKIRTRRGFEIINLNRRKGIRERCLNCSGWIRKEVERCTFKDCELQPYRSGIGKQDALARSIGIRKYCLDCCCGQTNEVNKCASFSCSLFPFRRSGVDRTHKIQSLGV